MSERATMKRKPRKRTPSRKKKMVELRCRFCGEPSGCFVNVWEPKVHEAGSVQATCKDCLPPC